MQEKPKKKKEGVSFMSEYDETQRKYVSGIYSIEEKINAEVWSEIAILKKPGFISCLSNIQADHLQDASEEEANRVANVSGGWKGTDHCNICRLPKSSKRSRLIYTRFVCPCDIDIVVEGEKHGEAWYGVDTIVDRHRSCRSTLEDESCPREAMSHWKFQTLMRLLSNSIETSSPSGSTAGLMEHCYFLSNSKSDEIYEDPTLVSSRAADSDTGDLQTSDVSSTENVAEGSEHGEVMPEAAYKAAKAPFLGEVQTEDNTLQDETLLDTNNCSVSSELSYENAVLMQQWKDTDGRFHSQNGRVLHNGVDKKRHLYPKGIFKESKQNCSGYQINKKTIPSNSCQSYVTSDVSDCECSFTSDIASQYIRDANNGHPYAHGHNVTATYVTTTPSSRVRCRETYIQLAGPVSCGALLCRPAKGIHDAGVQVTYKKESHLKTDRFSPLIPNTTTACLGTPVNNEYGTKTKSGVFQDIFSKCQPSRTWKQTLKKFSQRRREHKCSRYSWTKRAVILGHGCKVKKPHQAPKSTNQPSARSSKRQIHVKGILSRNRDLINSWKSPNSLHRIENASNLKIPSQNVRCPFRKTMKPPQRAGFSPSASAMLNECNNSNDATDQNASAFSDTIYAGRVVHVEGDGRCLFRSLVTAQSVKLQESRRDDFGHPERSEDAEEETIKADELRARVVALMRDNLHFYSQLEKGVINADQPDPVSYQKFLDRLDAMCKSSTMPGDLELNAAAMVLERQILVLNTDLKKITVYGQDRFPQSVPLAVRYTKLCADVGHYDAVILEGSNMVCDQKDLSPTKRHQALDLSCQDFSKLTINERPESKDSGNYDGKNSTKQSPRTNLQAKKEFFFNRDFSKNKFVCEKASERRTTITKNETGEGALKQAVNRRRSFYRANVGHENAALRRRLGQSCSKDLSSRRGLDSFGKETRPLSNKTDVGKRDSVIFKRAGSSYRSQAHPEGSQSKSNGSCWSFHHAVPRSSCRKRRNQDTNENSKHGTKRRRAGTEDNPADKKRRKKGSRSTDRNIRTSATSSRKGDEYLPNIYIKDGASLSQDKQKRYKRRVSSGHVQSLRKLRSRDGPTWVSDEEVTPMPPRLPDAFMIGQCRCLLCKKKVVSSTHSWLKCYLCLRVAHRECALKDSPGMSRGGDAEDIYFLCRYCVPV